MVKEENGGASTELPHSAQNLSDARARTLNTLIVFAQKFRDEISYVTAIAGSPVPGANRRVYIDLLESDTMELEEAIYDKFLPAVDDTILLKRMDVFGLGGWYVMCWVNGAAAPCFPAGNFI